MDSQGFIGDLLDFSFTKFITIKWVKLLFLAGLAILALELLAIELFGLITLFTGDGAAAKFMGFLMMIGALILVAIQVIALRIYLELVVVMFRIEENTRGLAGPKLTPPAGV
jgi:hypothetical protein